MKAEFFKNLEPFSLSRKDKLSFFKKEMRSLVHHHYTKSKVYKKLLNYFNYKTSNDKLENFPFLPTRLFKDLDLISVSKDKVFKILKSSGTSGSGPSKVYLDKNNAHNQTIVLTKILATIIGNKKRIPMLIVDQDPKLKDKTSFNARVAAIYGFSIFGKDHTYLLDDDNNIKYHDLDVFLKKYSKETFLIFGFTSLVFEHLIKKFSKKNFDFSLSNAVLLHGGGWKKMEKNKIDNKKFKFQLNQKFNLEKIYNYYGLVEQTGSIFLECEKCSCFVTSNFSEIIIRDEQFKIQKDGDRGYIQLLSLLPTSYPGHSILTEDMGEIVKDSNCYCSKKGTRFLVHGRINKSETRGCSDTI